jgi:hypothetical protein
MQAYEKTHAFDGGIGFLGGSSPCRRDSQKARPPAPLLALWNTSISMMQD